MMWFFAVLIVLAIGAVVVVAFGEGAPLSREYDDRPDALVPADGPLTGADLRAVRLSTAVRGYRASEVDALLDRLAAQLDASDDATDNASATSHDPEPDSGTMGG